MSWRVLKHNSHKSHNSHNSHKTKHSLCPCRAWGTTSLDTVIDPFYFILVFILHQVLPCMTRYVQIHPDTFCHCLGTGYSILGLAQPSQFKYVWVHPDMTRFIQICPDMSRYIQIHFATAYNWIEHTKLDTLSDTLVWSGTSWIASVPSLRSLYPPQKQSVLNVPKFYIVLKKTMNSIVCPLIHLQTHCGTSIWYILLLLVIP